MPKKLLKFKIKIDTIFPISYYHQTKTHKQNKLKIRTYKTKSSSDKMFLLSDNCNFNSRKFCTIFLGRDTVEFTILRTVFTD